MDRRVMVGCCVLRVCFIWHGLCYVGSFVITYTLIFGAILTVGCGLDGQDILQIRNHYFPGFTSLQECRDAGKETKRGFSCKKETT